MAEKALAEYLKYGGFPEVVLAQNDTDKSLILDSYFKDIVGLDVAEASGQHISIVDSFSRYVMQSGTFFGLQMPQLPQRTGLWDRQGKDIGA